MHQVLTKARRLHAEAISAHAEATKNLLTLEARVDAIGTQLGIISRARLDGKATAEQNAEFVLLTGDLEVLRAMRNERLTTVSQMADEVKQRQQELFQQEAQHQQELDRAAFAALVEKTRQVEALFVKALGQTFLAGHKTGLPTMGQCYQIGDTLHRALHLNIAPPTQGI